MIDLSTTYLGLELKSPVVCSSSPLCQQTSQLQEMEQAGAGAVVLQSLFEEQIRLGDMDLKAYLERAATGRDESLSYLPQLLGYNLGPDGYLDHVRRAKDVLGIPVIASLNARSMGGWVTHARLIESAGADALELNVHRIPTAKSLTSAQVEDDLVTVVHAVAAEVDIPLAVKIGPFYTAPAALAERLARAGAKGLVMFNRFYEPDFDIETLAVVPKLRLSSSDELLSRLHWAAILFEQTPLDLAITGGVHMAADVLKSIMAGASTAMMASALLANGVGHLRGVLEQVSAWMEAHDYDSVRSMKGQMSMRRVGDPEAFERGNYLDVLRTFATRLSAKESE